jgi:nucleoside-diphosphate-sugar epimerase
MSESVRMTAFQPLVLGDSQGQDLCSGSRNRSGGEMMSVRQKSAVFGAYGYTGGFAVTALKARGYEPVASGRDAAKLHALAATHDGLDTRVATVDDPASLDRALSGAAAGSTDVGHC